MAAHGRGVKRASKVSVRYFKEDPKRGPVLKITVQVGESQSEEEHMAFQNLLASIQKLQALSVPDAPILPLGLDIDGRAKD
uniref:Uncharacterized protein n=1 Tax=Leviviridae sp. TaxID=2027243 RepID=A0A514D0X7_9VIRU|nr:MAG: hypothetical protein H3Bulk411690_000002 [Leviviridae sp.]